MQTCAEETTAVIRQELTGFAARIDASEIETVLSGGAGIARIHGVEKRMAGELPEVPHGVMTLALNLEEETARGPGASDVRPRLAMLAMLLTLVAPAGTAHAQMGTTTPICGDAVVQLGEECDDGNQDDADGCLRTCFRPVRFVASDPHIHGFGCGSGLSPDSLLALSSARGTEVTAALVWGDGYEEDRRHFTGRDDPASSPGKLIHYDLEVSHFPAAKTGGHLLLLGLDSIEFSRDPFHSPRSGTLVLDWALAQGPRVVAGMAHGGFWPSDGSFPIPPAGCCTPWGFAVEAVRGRLHFLETELRGSGLPLDEGMLRLWKSVQNAGARVALAGASDYPCLHHSLVSNTPRTDVIMDGEITYDRWLDALRQGRTTVAVGNDNQLNLRANGVGLGGEVAIARGDVVRLSVEGRAAIPYSVQILANGVPVGSVNLGAGIEATAVDLRLEKSAWIAVASPWAMTSPVYVMVDAQPIRGAPEDICYLIRYVGHVSGLLRSQRLNVGSGEELAYTLAAHAEAGTELVKRFGEAGGTTCP